MAAENCYHCAYAYWDLGQTVQSFQTGFVSRPACANHPDSLGRMSPTPAGGVCRNYRAKAATPEGDVKRIPVGNGFYAYVDAADYEWLSQWTWRLCGGYAARQEHGKKIFMHREIVQAPNGAPVDHGNHNKLDNCRVNVRACTRRENACNAAKQAGSSSRFKGVYYRKRIRKWCGQLRSNGAFLWLGHFTDEVEAARAYDRAVVQHFGEFAHLNFPEDWPPERRQEIYAEHPRRGESSFARIPVGPQRAKGKKVGRKERKKDAPSKKRRAGGRKARVAKARRMKDSREKRKNPKSRK